MGINDVLADIVKGNFDKNLTEIADAVKARTVKVSERVFRDISVGTQFRVVENIRPKTLSGMLVEVVKKNPKNVMVKPLKATGTNWDIGFTLKPEFIAEVIGK